MAEKKKTSVSVDFTPPPAAGPQSYDDLFGGKTDLSPQGTGGPLDTRTMLEKQEAARANTPAVDTRSDRQKYLDSSETPGDSFTSPAEHAKIDAEAQARKEGHAPDQLDFAPPSAAGVGPAGAAPAGPDPYANARWGQQGGGGGAVRVPDQELWRVGSQVQNAFGAADQQENAAVAGTAEDEAGNAVAEQGALHQIAADEQKRQAAIDQREKSRAAELKSYQEQADRLAEEATSVGIDSKKMWNDMGTGRSTLAILGMALGNFSSNGNQAANLLESAWQKDIDAQKANVSLLGDRAKLAQGMFGQALNRFGDERQAEAATHQAYLAATEIKLKEMAASLKPGQAQDKARELLAALAEKRAERLSQMLQFAPAHVVGGGGGGPTEKEIRKRAQDLSDKAAEHGVNMSVGEARARAISEFSGPGSVGGLGSQGYAKPGGGKSEAFSDHALTFNGPDGRPYIANSPDSRKVLADASIQKQNADNSMNAYESALKNLSTSDQAALKLGNTTQAMQQAQTAYSAYQSDYRKLTQGTVWKASEAPLIALEAPGPDAFLGKPLVAIHAARKMVNGIWNSTLNSEAPTPAAGGQASRPAGPPPSLQPGPAPK